MVNLKEKHRLEPTDDECAVCFALEHGEVELDERKESYMVCERHGKMLKNKDKRKYNKDRVEHLFKLRKEEKLHWSIVPIFIFIIIMIFLGGTMWWIPLAGVFILVVIAVQHSVNKITKEIEKELGING